MKRNVQIKLLEQPYYTKLYNNNNNNNMLPSNKMGKVNILEDKIKSLKIEQVC